MSGSKNNQGASALYDIQSKESEPARDSGRQKSTYSYQMQNCAGSPRDCLSMRDMKQAYQPSIILYHHPQQKNSIFQTRQHPIGHNGLDVLKTHRDTMHQHLSAFNKPSRGHSATHHLSACLNHKKESFRSVMNGGSQNQNDI